MITTLAITLSLVACGKDKASTVTTPDTTSQAETTSESTSDTSNTVDFVEVTGNGISLQLPSDITYIKTDDDFGAMIFANEERTSVITLGVMSEDTVTYEDITDEVLLYALSGGGELRDATLDDSVTVEQKESTSVVGLVK